MLRLAITEGRCCQVNFVTSIWRTLRAPITRIISDLSLMLLLLIGLAECGDQVRLSSRYQLLEFENAEPPRPVVDVDRPVQSAPAAAIDGAFEQQSPTA